MEITIYYTLCVAHGTSEGNMFLIKLKFRAVEQSFSYTMRYRLSCLTRLPANGRFWCLFWAGETNLSCTYPLTPTKYIKKNILFDFQREF